MHLVDSDGGLSPSAFIPFCSFGEDMSAMGTQIRSFHDPVCSSFKAKIRNDQLCYEVNLQDYKDEGNLHDQLEQGLVLLIDLNTERQRPKWRATKTKKETKFCLEEDNTFQIHLDTKSITVIFLMRTNFDSQILFIWLERENTISIF